VSDTNDLRKYIEREMRVDKLDTSLLFVISSLGLIFSVLQIFLTERFVLVYILTPLLVGFVLPFWYGFLQGAVFHDRPITRCKGWIYLYYGIFLYFIILIPHSLTKVFPDNPAVKLSNIIPLMAGMLSGSVVREICSRIFDIFDRTISPVDDEIIDKTALAALYFLVSGVLLITYLEDFDYLFLIGLILFILLGLISERSSLGYIGKYDEPYEVVRKKMHPRIANSFAAIGIIFFVLFLVYESLESIFGSELYIRITLMVIASSFITLYTALRPLTIVKFTVKKEE